MPEGARQGDTIKQAYMRAKRSPSDAFFVELHATGTFVGDPIEANGKYRILMDECRVLKCKLDISGWRDLFSGQGRQQDSEVGFYQVAIDRRLRCLCGCRRIGSVKGNIGHTEGCSFLASLIKVSMMLHYKEIVPNIRFNLPNPKIDFLKGMMRVQTQVWSQPFTIVLCSRDLM